jgi:hypothetical protein
MLVNRTFLLLLLGALFVLSAASASSFAFDEQAAAESYQRTRLISKEAGSKLAPAFRPPAVPLGLFCVRFVVFLSLNGNVFFCLVSGEQPLLIDLVLR